MRHVVIIDNYDSFVYNLARAFTELGARCSVFRNDQIDLQTIQNINPSHIVLSPGPCAPKDSGICLDLIKAFENKYPMLGVCLGHQAIGEHFGAKLVSAHYPIHGKAHAVWHEEKGVLENLPNPLVAARYHALALSPEAWPDALKITGRTQAGEIMALQHRILPIFGVQFHPESIMTPQGLLILKNFLMTSA